MVGKKLESFKISGEFQTVCCKDCCFWWTQNKSFNQAPKNKVKVTGKMK